MNTETTYKPTTESAANHLRAYQFGEKLDGADVPCKHSFDLCDADVRFILQALEFPFDYICHLLTERRGDNCHGFETDGESIFAGTYEKARTIADFLEAVFGYVMKIEEYDDGFVVEPD